MWWVQTNTHSAMLLGAMAVIRTVTAIILSPFAGALVDRFNRKFFLVTMDVARFFTYGLLAYLTYAGNMNVPLLLSLVTLNSICNEFFNPAVNASVPLIVEREDLPRANSLQGITGTIVSIVGYGAGGILVAAVGVPLLLLIDSISFLFSAGAEAFVSIPKVKQTAERAANSFLKDVKEGLVYVKASPVLFNILQVAAALNFFFAPISILLPKFVQQDLGASSAVYGYLLSAEMAGVLLASVLLAATKLVQRNIWSVLYGLTIQGGLMMLFALLPGAFFPVRIALFFLMGFFNGLVNIYFGAVVQAATAPEHLGKVFGLISAICSALQPLSQGASGILGDRVSVPLIFAVCSVFMAAGGLKFRSIPNLRKFLLPEQDGATAQLAAEPAPANN
jgi:MFS family permease